MKKHIGQKNLNLIGSCLNIWEVCTIKDFSRKLYLTSKKKFYILEGQKQQTARLLKQQDLAQFVPLLLHLKRPEYFWKLSQWLI